LKAVEQITSCDECWNRLLNHGHRQSARETWSRAMVMSRAIDTRSAIGMQTFFVPRLESVRR
jgi:hypothetical protein